MIYEDWIKSSSFIEDFDAYASAIDAVNADVQVIY